MKKRLRNFSSKLMKDEEKTEQVWESTPPGYLCP